MGIKDSLPGPVLGCPTHLSHVRGEIVAHGAALFTRLDVEGVGAIQYQHFVERMQQMPRDELLAYGLTSDADIASFASQVLDFSRSRALPRPPRTLTLSLARPLPVRYGTSNMALRCLINYLLSWSSRSTVEPRRTRFSTSTASTMTHTLGRKAGQR
jgi:hypothetical protein